MIFGEYIRKKREAAGLTQKDVLGQNQNGHSWLSDIELGKRYPATRKTIEKLALALHLDESEQYADWEKFVDWLWLYSLVDCDPRYYFEPPISSEKSLDSEEISLNSSEQEVLSHLGRPNRRFSLPSKSKWIYEDEGVHIIFAEGKVVDILFK